MTYLTHLVRLLYDPQGAVSALRRSRPLIPTLVVSGITTVVYNVILAGIHSDLIGIARVGGFDEGGARILLGYLLAIPWLLQPLVFLALLYVPSALLVLGLLVPARGATDTLRRHYGTTVVVALSAWAVTLALWTVPAIVFVVPTSPSSVVGFTILPVLTFLVFMTVALASTEQAGYGRGAVAALVGGVSLILMPLASGLVFLLTSPIFLIILFFVLRGVVRDWGTSRSQRERLRQNLEASTLNPADSSAHVNLGIIYQEQDDLDRAAQHFEKAVEIDPYEVDALYQLGRIARARGDYSGAIGRFDAVVRIDEAHAHSEVWREVGATYLAAGQFEDAEAALDRFLANRPSDAEGLYLKALVLDGLGRPQEARTQMMAVIDAVKTAPAYKYRLERRWMREAEAYLNRQ